MKNERQKLLKDLDEVFSKYIRTRDNKCILCGGHVGEINKLQNHHWIVRRSRSLRYRFDERNCVSLCYACHILKVHNSPTVAQIDELKERCLNEGIATQQDIEEIMSHSSEISKMGIGDIKNKIEYYKQKLKEIEK